MFSNKIKLNFAIAKVVSYIEAIHLFNLLDFRPSPILEALTSFTPNENTSTGFPYPILLLSKNENDKVKNLKTQITRYIQNQLKPKRRKSDAELLQDCNNLSTTEKVFVVVVGVTMIYCFIDVF
jgi:hypothetical protein